MKKFILFSALTAGTISGSAAQEPIKFGARAGLNFDSQRSSSGGQSETSSSKLGFHLGAVVDVPLARYAPSLPAWFYFQPGLYFTSKGGKVKRSLSGYKNTNTNSLYYLELPLLASMKYPVADGVKVRAHFGPSVGFALIGKGKWKTTVGGKTTSGESNVFDSDDMSRFHFGLGFGVGVDYRQLYLGLGYDLGLSNMYTGDGNASIKNRTFGVSLGYSF
jgi:hypothetical protein